MDPEPDHIQLFANFSYIDHDDHTNSGLGCLILLSINRSGQITYNVDDHNMIMMIIQIEGLDVCLIIQLSTSVNIAQYGPAAAKFLPNNHQPRPHHQHWHHQHLCHQCHQPRPHHQYWHHQPGRFFVPSSLS